MAEVEFYYNGSNIKVQCNQNDRMGDIQSRFKSKVGSSQNSFVYLYNGHTLSNESLTFYELANPDDRKRKKMNIIATESKYSNTNQFIYEKCLVEDDSMKEFAEMMILYAIQKYPDDDWEKCEFIMTKFEEKYGGKWGTSFLKNGDSAYWYNGYYIKVKYGGYTIKILRTKEN